MKKTITLIAIVSIIACSKKDDVNPKAPSQRVKFDTSVPSFFILGTDSMGYGGGGISPDITPYAAYFAKSPYYRYLAMTAVKRNKSSNICFTYGDTTNKTVMHESIEYDVVNMYFQDSLVKYIPIKPFFIKAIGVTDYYTNKTTVHIKFSDLKMVNVSDTSDIRPFGMWLTLN